MNDGTAAHETHLKLKDFVDSVCQEFQAKARQNGIHLNFSSSLSEESKPEDEAVVLKIRKGHWPLRSVSRLEIHEKSEDELRFSNYCYSLKSNFGNGFSAGLAVFTPSLKTKPQEALGAKLNELFYTEVLNPTEAKKLWATAPQIA
jgi:hypothetical protein